MKKEGGREGEGLHAAAASIGLANLRPNNHAVPVATGGCFFLSVYPLNF